MRESGFCESISSLDSDVGEKCKISAKIVNNILKFKAPLGHLFDFFRDLPYE